MKMLLKNKAKKIGFMTNNKGFSLIEALVAISVVVVGIGGGLMITANSIKVGTLGSQEFIASNLAQEGVEFTRAFRDKYWLEGLDYDQMSSRGYIPKEGVSRSYRVHINSRGKLVMESVLYSDPFANGFLLYNSPGGDLDGVFTHDISKTESIFYRKVDIRRAGVGDEDFLQGGLIVTCVVSWKTNTGNKSVELQDVLYDWK